MRKDFYGAWPWARYLTFVERPFEQQLELLALPKEVGRFDSSASWVRWYEGPLELESLQRELLLGLDQLWRREGVGKQLYVLFETRNPHWSALALPEIARAPRLEFMRIGMNELAEVRKVDLARSPILCHSEEARVVDLRFITITSIFDDRYLPSYGFNHFENCKAAAGARWIRAFLEDDDLSRIPVMYGKRLTNFDSETHLKQGDTYVSMWDEDRHHDLGFYAHAFRRFGRLDNWFDDPERCVEGSKIIAGRGGLRNRFGIPQVDECFSKFGLFPGDEEFYTGRVAVIGVGPWDGVSEQEFLNCVYTKQYFSTDEIDRAVAQRQELHEEREWWTLVGEVKRQYREQGLGDFKYNSLDSIKKLLPLFFERFAVEYRTLFYGEDILTKDHIRVSADDVLSACGKYFRLCGVDRGYEVFGADCKSVEPGGVVKLTEFPDDVDALEAGGLRVYVRDNRFYGISFLFKGVEGQFVGLPVFGDIHRPGFLRGLDDLGLGRIVVGDPDAVYLPDARIAFELVTPGAGWWEAVIKVTYWDPELVSVAQFLEWYGLEESSLVLYERPVVDPGLDVGQVASPLISRDQCAGWWFTCSVPGGVDLDAAASDVVRRVGLGDRYVDFDMDGVAYQVCGGEEVFFEDQPQVPAVGRQFWLQGTEVRRWLLSEKRRRRYGVFGIGYEAGCDAFEGLILPVDPTDPCFVAALRGLGFEVGVAYDGSGVYMPQPGVFIGKGEVNYFHVQEGQEANLQALGLDSSVLDSVR